MSLADEVTAALERDIVLGRIAPGVHLDEGSLSKRFDVSRTPIREALERLSVSGLVEIRPRRGAVVACVSEAAMAQRFEALAGLEGLCAYYAAIRMTPLQREALHDAHRRCRVPAAASEYRRYYAADMIFHRLILEGCGNDVLVEKTLEVRRSLRPWRRLQLYVPGRVEASFAEHGEITAAIVAGDAPQAERLTRAHVEGQSRTAGDLVSGETELPASAVS